MSQISPDISNSLTTEEILLLNQRAARIDVILVGVVFALSAALGVLFSLQYKPEYPTVISSAMSLQAQDFIADNTYLGREIQQNDEGHLVAVKDGQVLQSFVPEYGSFTLVVEDGADGEKKYSAVFSPDR